MKRPPELPEQRIFASQVSTGAWIPAVWCALHDRHPSECFDLHHPELWPEVDA